MSVEIKRPAKKLDAKGRCCGRKPSVYRRPNSNIKVSPYLFCDRCDCAYDTAGTQVENWVWREYEGGFAHVADMRSRERAS